MDWSLSDSEGEREEFTGPPTPRAPPPKPGQRRLPSPHPAPAPKRRSPAPPASQGSFEDVDLNQLIAELNLDFGDLGLPSASSSFEDLVGAPSDVVQTMADMAASRLQVTVAKRVSQGRAREWVFTEDPAPEPIEVREGGLPPDLATALEPDIIIDVDVTGDAEEWGPVDFSPYMHAAFPDRLVAAFPRSIPREHIPFIIYPYPRTPSTVAFTLEAIQNHALVLYKTIKKKTVESYGSVVRDYLAFCDEQQVPIQARFPSKRDVVEHFMTSYVAKVKAKTVSKKVDAMRFWHSIHGLELDLPRDIWRRIMRGLLACEPPGKEPRPPALYKDLQVLYEMLDHDDPEDVALFAAATTAFFGMARPGDVTLPTRNAFNPVEHPTGASVTFHPATANFPEHATVQLPYDKVRKRKGDTLVLTGQTVDDRLSPLTALRRHLELNKPSSDDFLFSSVPRDPSSPGLYPLTYSHFTKRVNELLKARDPKHAGLAGHSWRIGGATFYLLADIHPDFIKVIGRWRSDAFLRYWRRIKIIAAKHLTDAPLVDPGPLPRASDL